MTDDVANSIQSVRVLTRVGEVVSLCSEADQRQRRESSPPVIRLLHYNNQKNRYGGYLFTEYYIKTSFIDTLLN